VLVCDTGPLVAAAISDDAHHRACVDLFTTLHLANRRILVAEVATLDRRHFTVVRPRHVDALTLLPE
jgi:predicted nucleic acid-binding protein